MKYGLKNELTVCVGRDSHLISPLLGLVIDSEQINGFVRFPAGTAEDDWLIRLVIVLVSPDLAGLKSAWPNNWLLPSTPPVIRIFLSPGSVTALWPLRGRMPLWGTDVSSNCGEIRSRGNGVGIVKTRYIGAEHEDFSVGEQRGAGRMEIEAALGRDRARARIELVDGVSCVALEQEQARITQLERPVAGADDRHRCRVERKSLIRHIRFHRSGVTAGE